VVQAGTRREGGPRAKQGLDRTELPLGHMPLYRRNTRLVDWDICRSTEETHVDWDICRSTEETLAW
jgi:hypothetical protein